MRKILQHIILSIILIMSFQLSAQENVKNYYSFGGHVFSGDFPIEKGYVYLYSYPDFEIFEETPIDTLGYYYFYRVLEGEYLVYAGLSIDDPNFGEFSYTYYPNTLYWDESNAIVLNETNWEYDIKLVNQETEGVGNGFGKISGTIFNEGNKPIAEGVDVILFDQDMQSLMHIPTDEMGRFNFEDLENGSYIIYPQVIGYTTAPILVEISDESNEFNNIEITMKDGLISSYINESVVVNQSVMFYPNPASSQLNLQFETRGSHYIQSRIMDLSGRVIFESENEYNTTLYTAAFETAAWENGYYLFEVLVDGQQAITQKIVIVH